jgi:hypothetical protein
MDVRWTTNRRWVRANRVDCETPRRLTGLCRILLAALTLCVFGPARVQAQFRVQADAISGQPFGVGVLSVQAQLGQRLSEPAEGQISLAERGGRTFYPAFEERPAAQLVRNFIGTRRRMTVFFLFTGDAPLELTLSAGQPIRQTVTPHPGNRQQMFADWWREFSRADSADPYPQVHNYLVSTLARRLELRPAAAGLSLASLAGGMSGELSLLSGGESTRVALAQQILLDGGSADEPLDVELPPAAPYAEEVPLPGIDAAVAIEPIALRVPEECFYVRAGSFPNFLWFQHRLEAWGGNVRNLISEQSVEYDLNGRFQRQIALKESALAPVLGPAVIADVAIIGTDTFLRDGAAMGILFQARNSAVLGLDIQRQRSESLKAASGATEEKLTILGRSVSFVSTPDNALRSFYVADGDYHFVSTSRALVQRFLETGAAPQDPVGGDGKAALGRTSLGASPEFRLARANMPLDRNDTIFVYLSRAFFRNLISPHYQIELLRRLRSSVEMELVELAVLLARSERQPASSVDELIVAGALPAWFGRRVDGSRLTFADGELADTLRGVRSGFIPIPDMPLGKVTHDEAEAYDKIASEAARNWGEMDPVIVGILRTDSRQPELEHVSLDIQAAPLSPRNYGMLSKWLGPAAEQRLAPVAGNLVDLQASLRGGSLLQTGDHYLFFGLQDSVAADLGQVDQPVLNLLKTMTGQSPLRGYLGAWPQPGLLNLVGAGANAASDPAGYSRLLTGVWRRMFDQFTVMSFHREVLEQTTPQLRFDPSPHPAQLRAHVEDLQGTNLAQWVNQQGYKSARRMSSANTHLTAELSEQFGVAPEQSLKVAETVLDAKLVDPLGGEYQLVGTQVGSKQWVSNKLGSTTAADYHFPALTWIRGLDAEGRLESGQLVLHAEIEMPIRVDSVPTSAAAKPSGARPQPATTAPGRLVPGPAPRPNVAVPRSAAPAPGPVAPRSVVPRVPAPTVAPPENLPAPGPKPGPPAPNESAAMRR